MRAYESVSTWRQPEPVPLSEARTALIAAVAERIHQLSPGRLRVAVDGFTAAGKTSFGHELAGALRGHGRTTLRASLDDFKNPWREARELGYDRITGEGYYRNAYDFDSARTLLLAPAGAAGSGTVGLCAHDPLTGEDQRAVTVNAPADAVLVVDSVFAFRPEYDDFWDFRIWLDVDPDVSLARGIERDTMPRAVLMRLRGCIGTATMRPRRSTWLRSARNRWRMWSSTTATLLVQESRGDERGNTLRPTRFCQDLSSPRTGVEDLHHRL